MVKIRQTKASQSVILLNIKFKVLFKVKVNFNVKVKVRVIVLGTHIRFPENLVKIGQALASEEVVSRVGGWWWWWWWMAVILIIMPASAKAEQFYIE